MAGQSPCQRKLTHPLGERNALLMAAGCQKYFCVTFDKSNKTCVSIGSERKGIELKRTISGMVGKGSLAHNNRDFVADNIDRNRIADNVIYLNEDLKQVYLELFSDALERYNAKQKRNDRKIPDYYQHIRSGKQEKLFHEVVFQIGNVGDTAVGTLEGQLAKTVLNDFAKGFQERNPQFRVFSAHLHMDEATPHLHIDFVPYITGSKRGLDTRISMKKALEAQGFADGSREDTELNQWINSEKVALSQVMERYDIEWEQRGTHNEHLSVLDFKKQERSKEIKKLEKSITKIQNQQVEVQAVESIEAKPVPLSSKVMLSQNDYQTLMTAAQKYVVQVKKERKLEKLLQAAEKTITGLKAKVTELTETISSLTRQLDQYRSVRGQLTVGSLQQENKELKQRNSLYKSIIEQNGLAHLLGIKKDQRQTRDVR